MEVSRPHAGFSLVIASQVFFLALALLLIWWLDVSLPAAAISPWAAVLAGLALAVVTFAIFALVYRFGGHFAASLLADLQRISSLFSKYSWWQLALVAALAGLGEELLFRGFLQLWLDDYFPVYWAIVLSSVVFGLLHYLSHAYFICALLMSLAFGLGYWLSGSLLMVMVWHGAYDLLALAVVVKYPAALERFTRRNSQ